MLSMWKCKDLPTHRKGSTIMGSRIPRASKVEVVFATSELPLEDNRKSVRKGKL